MTDKGVFYVAYGTRARKEALLSIATLKRSNPTLPVCIVSDDIQVFKSDTQDQLEFDSDKHGRLAKLNIDQLSPFKHTLYLDADTRVYLPLDSLFKPLTDGFEFVATASEQQGANWLWHIDDSEREITANEIGISNPLQIQGGVWAFKKTPKMRSFFSHWRKEYKRFDSIYDQAALTRAWHKVPIKTWLVGREFNGGAVIAHLFGNAKRKD
jgi:hypothetical protein